MPDLTLDLPAKPTSAAAARRAVESLLRLEGELLETVSSCWSRSS